MPDDGFNLLGSSYDNTGALGASTWRHVAFIEQPSPDGRRALADVLGRVQALHARRLPRRLPDRLAVPHRVRHGRRAGRHLQRLRLLRPGLPVRRDRAPHRRRRDEERRHRPEVHALLRPPRRRAHAGVRAGVPDRVDPVRRPRRAARAGRGARRRPCTSRACRGAALRRGPRRRRRRRRRDVPAARRARDLRPAAGPGGADPRPAADVAARAAARRARAASPARSPPFVGRKRR